MSNNEIIILYNYVNKLSSPDNADTIIQLQEVSDVLTRNGYNVIPVVFDENIGKTEKYIKGLNPVAVFNLVENVKNTDGLSYTAPALLEYLGYPYSGCPAWSLAALASKITAKKILMQSNLPTPPFFELGDKLPNETSEKWIVKSITENASLGMDRTCIVTSTTAANKRLKTEALKGNKWFAEKFISGREFNVSIIEDVNGKALILPPAEMTYSHCSIGDNIVDYASKWDNSSPDYDLFIRNFEHSQEDNKLIEKIKNISTICWDIFGLKGAARIDFRVDEQSNPWILEINANPCLSSDAGLVAAAAMAGISFNDLILGLIPKTVLASKSNVKYKIKQKVHV